MVVFYRFGINLNRNLVIWLYPQKEDKLEVCRRDNWFIETVIELDSLCLCRLLIVMIQNIETEKCRRQNEEMEME